MKSFYFKEGYQSIKNELEKTTIKNPDENIQQLINECKQNIVDNLHTLAFLTSLEDTHIGFYLTLQHKTIFHG